MKIKRKIPMYIAVQLERGDKRVWLPLPATKAKFADALEKIGGADGGSYQRLRARRPIYQREQADENAALRGESPRVKAEQT